MGKGKPALRAMILGSLALGIAVAGSVAAEAANRSPRAFATVNGIVVMPTDYTYLDGTQSADADGRIVSYRWTQLEGPNAAVIADPAAVKPKVSGLVPGTYRFRLVVTDERGARDSDWTGLLVVGNAPPARTAPLPEITPAPKPSPAPVAAKPVPSPAPAAPTSTGTTSIFQALTPDTQTIDEGSSVNLGVKFRSSVAGKVVGVRFYKVPGAAGPHVGALWDGSGRKLAEATFAAESASGWQSVRFAAPVAISANALYTVSYLAPRGQYASRHFAFRDGGFSAGSLSAPGSASVGGNGVYAYASGVTFPSRTYNDSNYYVDVLFEGGSPTAQPTPSPTLVPDSKPAPSPTLAPKPVPSPSPTLAPKPAPSSAPSPAPAPAPATPPAAGASASIGIVPMSDAEDFVGPARGAEVWHNPTQNSVDYPTAGGGFQSQDFYSRFAWSQLETSEGQYNWTFFDGLLKRAIDNGWKYSFGVMTHCPAGDCPAMASYDGGASAYPEYVHDRMQAENPKDWISDGGWVPNWNSPSYHAAFEKLLKAINARLETTSYKGVLFKDIVTSIDIRGYGTWGEWHTGSVGGKTVFPAGTYATNESLVRIIDAHVNAFPDHQLMAMIAAYMNVFDVIANPAPVGYRILTAKTRRGPVGFRRDSWGSEEPYLHDQAVNNPMSYNGLVFKTEIMNRWKTAPVNGEPQPGVPGSCPYSALKAQVQLFHVISIGNENYNGAAGSACSKEAIRAAFRASGYRVVLREGARTATVASDRKLTVNLKWQNLGVSPTYEDWTTTFELRNASGAVVWSGASSHAMRLFLPKVDASGKTLADPSLATPVTDTFTLPSGVAPGAYSLHLVIRDPKGYRKPFPLAIQGRQADGSYPLGAVTVAP